MKRLFLWLTTCVIILTSPLHPMTPEQCEKEHVRCGNERTMGLSGAATAANSGRVCGITVAQMAAGVIVAALVMVIAIVISNEESAHSH